MKIIIMAIITMALIKIMSTIIIIKYNNDNNDNNNNNTINHLLSSERNKRGFGYNSRHFKD